ncbi:MAG: fluoride efflux transporter CrcB [Beijerinckiaceae bacterium]
MKAVVLVFVGAGVGGVLRHLVNVSCAQLCGTTFPWGTLAVNVAGSFLMGLLAGWLAFRGAGGWSQGMRLFLATGVLGGFTTFSAFSLDAALLWERGQFAAAGLYVLGSVIASLAALAGGLMLVRSMA